MYFLTEAERKKSGSTNYHEFYKGKWDTEKMPFWSADSISMSDDDLIALSMQKLISSAVPEYDPFGETEIDRDQWTCITQKAKEAGGQLYSAILELTPWVEETFEQHCCFTILGL